MGFILCPFLVFTKVKLKRQPLCLAKLITLKIKIMASSIRLKKDVIKMYAMTAHLRSLIKQDKLFKKNFQKDPVGMLEEFGLSRKQAVNIIANDIGVKVASDWCICTGCCCTGCCISSKSVISTRVLPAISDAAGWKKLSLGK